MRTWGLPLFLIVPFVCLVLSYAILLCWANWRMSLPRDSIISILVVATIMLALNPLHFFNVRMRAGTSRSGSRNLNRYFFVIRYFELVFAVCAIVNTWSHPIPNDLCSGGPHEGSWLLSMKPALTYQLAISVVMHYVAVCLLLITPEHENNLFLTFMIPRYLSHPSPNVF